MTNSEKPKDYIVEDDYSPYVIMKTDSGQQSIQGDKESSSGELNSAINMSSSIYPTANYTISFYSFTDNYEDPENYQSLKRNPLKEQQYELNYYQSLTKTKAKTEETKN